MTDWRQAGGMLSRDCSEYLRCSSWRAVLEVGGVLLSGPFSLGLLSVEIVSEVDGRGEGPRE